jgi:hypothetical protein
LPIDPDESDGAFPFLSNGLRQVPGVNDGADFKELISAMRLFMPHATMRLVGDGRAVVVVVGLIVCLFVCLFKDSALEVPFLARTHFFFFLSFQIHDSLHLSSFPPPLTAYPPPLPNPFLVVVFLVQIFRLLTGLLHLGNLKMVEDSAGYAVVEEDEALDACCALFGVERDAMKFSLTNRQIQTGNRGSIAVKQLEVDTATVVKETLAKSVYAVSRLKKPKKWGYEKKCVWREVAF